MGAGRGVERPAKHVPSLDFLGEKSGDVWKYSHIA
jgi:hypothetical protein